MLLSYPGLDYASWSIQSSLITLFGRHFTTQVKSETLGFQNLVPSAPMLNGHRAQWSSGTGRL